MTEKEMQDRFEDLEALVRKGAQAGEREAVSLWERVPKVARARTLAAFGVLAAVAALLWAVVPDGAALGSWLAQHAQWSVQVAFVAAAAVLVVAAFLLLQATVLDPLLIGPEVRQAWLDWYAGWRKGERNRETDGRFMLAGAVLAGCTLLMMGLIALGVFLMAGV